MDHMIVLYYLHQLLCEQQSENIKGLITWHFVLGCPTPFYLCCFHSLRKVGASQDLCGLKYVTCFHGHDTKKKSSSPITKLFQTCMWSFYICCETECWGA